jgi:dTDP-4-amino-4,6-dideoxygalactose transaminase
MMEVKMAYLDRLYRENKANLDRAWHSTVQSGRFIGGQAVKNIENQLSDYLGVNHVITCANGTDALLASLMALDIGPDDEVIMPAYGYFSAFEMCQLLKAKPVLVDIDKYFHIDATLVESKITSKTKAIVVQHLYGQVADMDALTKIAGQNNIPLIEDSAQAIGSTQKVGGGQEKHAGTIGRIGTFSFFPTKNLACFGDGGAIVTDSAELATKLRLICTHGQTTKYHHTLIGMNSRLDSLQAAILTAQLPELDHWNNQRREHARRYQDVFNDLNIENPQERANTHHTYHQYCILSLKRDELQRYLKEQGIESIIYYPRAIHQQDIAKRYSAGHYPQSERVAQQLLAIPLSPQLTEDEFNYVVDKIIHWHDHE